MKKPSAPSARNPGTTRRSFLRKAAAGAAGVAVGVGCAKEDKNAQPAPTTTDRPEQAPAQAQTQPGTPITLRFQSTWPTKDIFHEFALDFAKKVNEMSGGRLQIEVLPAGAVVKAFDLL